MKLQILTISLLSLAGTALFVGCTSLSSATGKQGTVCPDCKVVVETQRVQIDDFEYYAYGDQEVEVKRHRCPGCQGAVMTLIKEGTFQHKCTTCEGKPFVCSLSHKL